MTQKLKKEKVTMDFEKNKLIVEKIASKKLPLPQEDLQTVKSFCQEQFRLGNLSVNLTQSIPYILRKDWIENKNNSCCGIKHIDTPHSQWRTALGKECQEIVRQYLRSYLATNTCSLLIWRGALPFASLLAEHNIKMLHMQAARDEETLVVSSPMPLSARDEGFLKGFKGTVFVPDVMLAAGSSTNFTIELLHSFGIPNERIVIGCIIAAPEGVFRLLDNYPGIKIIAATVDNCLDKNAYISPGLGDAGDLLFDRITIEYFRRIFHIFDKGQWEHLGELIRKANPE